MSWVLYGEQAKEGTLRLTYSDDELLALSEGDTGVFLQRWIAGLTDPERVILVAPRRLFVALMPDLVAEMDASVVSTIQGALPEEEPNPGPGDLTSMKSWGKRSAPSPNNPLAKWRESQ